MAAERKALTTEYSEIAEDLTAILGVQVPKDASKYEIGVEFAPGSSLPAADVVGEQLVSGDTILADKIVALWTSGKLYARVAWGDSVGAVLVR
jgi:hypothetical protein